MQFVKRAFGVCLAVALVCPAQTIPDILGEAAPRPQILLLGVFHFRDAGRDDHKPQHQFDILSEKRQAELEVVLDRLREFGPTRIAVERRLPSEERLNRDYRAFRRGEFELTSHEIHQIGFRLAESLGHERLYAIDARGHDMIGNWDAWSQKIKDYGQADLETEWAEEYRRLAEWEDRLVDEQPLIRSLLHHSSQERARISHGMYLVGNAKAGQGDDYLGPDSRTRWYNRNLRIFNNIQRIPVEKADRVLVIIGAGHLPILQLCTKSSPDYLFVSAEDVLTQ